MNQAAIAQIERQQLNLTGTVLDVEARNLQPGDFVVRNANRVTHVMVQSDSTRFWYGHTSVVSAPSDLVYRIVRP